MQLAEKLNEYYIRTFRQRDEVELAQLFNRIYVNFAGFVPRTPQYWVWCCLMRPDVNKESVVIVNKEKDIVGYAVVGESGNIWELCYDPQYNGKIIVSKLLNWAIKYLEKVRSDYIVLDAPIKDDVVREVCQELNLTETTPSSMFVSILDFPKLICAILVNKKEMLDIDGLFWFRLKGCPSWCNNSFGINIRAKKVSVIEKIVDRPEILIDTDIFTLTSYIFGTENILKVIITSKMRFHPFWKIRKFLNLFSLLRIKHSWFRPRADLG